MWYDKLSIIPGYRGPRSATTSQAADRHTVPTRSIAQLIDLAVPGGHAQALRRGRPVSTSRSAAASVARRAHRQLRRRFRARAPRRRRAAAGGVVAARSQQTTPTASSGCSRAAPCSARSCSRSTAPALVSVRDPRSACASSITGASTSTARSRPATIWRAALEARPPPTPAWRTADVTALAAHARDPADCPPRPWRPPTSPAPSRAGGLRTCCSRARRSGDPRSVCSEVPFRSVKGVPWKRSGDLIAHAATTRRGVPHRAARLRRRLPEVSDDGVHQRRH